MAMSSEESDGKEESARDCCTSHCDKSCLQNASHSCTQALQAAHAPHHELIQHADEGEAAAVAAASSSPSSSSSSAAAAAAAAAAASAGSAAEEDDHPPSPSLLSPETLASAFTHHQDLPSPSLHLRQNREIAGPHQNAGDDTEYVAATDNTCATETNSPHEQPLHDMALLNQSPSSNCKPESRRTSNFSSSPPDNTSTSRIDQETKIEAFSRHSQLQEELASLPKNNASVRNSNDFSSAAYSLDPNAREFIPIVPSFSSPPAVPQQKTQSLAPHSYTPFQVQMSSLHHQMGSLSLEVGAMSSMASYEPIPPNHEHNHASHDMPLTPFYNTEPGVIPEGDYYTSFHQKPEGAYENHGYGVYQAASHMGFPVHVPGAVLANPAPLHHMVLPPIPPAMATSPSPFTAAPAPSFMSVPPAGLIDAQSSSVLHSQRQYPPSYGHGNSKEHVSRALCISGLPPNHNEAQVREELERWGTIRGIQAEASSQGFQVMVQFFDLRAARQALRDMQNMYQQSHELHRNPPFKHHVGVHNEGLAGKVRMGLLCGNVVLVQYIAACTMRIPDVKNQGTLVLFNVGADVNMQDLRRIFEVYGNVREVREAPTRRQHKFVEFYDIRSAAAACEALNGQEICGKCVKIEYSHQGDTATRRQKAQDKAHKETIAAHSTAGAQQIQGPVSMDLFSWNGDMTSAHGVQGYINGWERWSSPHDGFFALNPVNACMANHPNILPVPNVTLHQDAVSNYSAGRFPGDGSGRTGAHEGRHRIPSGPRRGQQSHNFDLEFRQVAAMQSHCVGVKDRHMGGTRHLKGDADFKFDEDEMYARPTNPRTTLMIQNIPNKYSQKMLLSLLDQHCLQSNNNLGSNEPEAAYDFMYLPIDFKNKCNLGYAFVNFTTAQATLGFYKVFHGKAWEEFNSRKICGVAFARLQGRAALEEHFRTSRFACDTEEYLPVLFAPPRNGTNLSQPRVAVGQLGMGRGCRTGNGGHSLYPHSISEEPTDSVSEQNKAPVHSNSDTSSASEAEEVSTQGVANTSDAGEMPPSEMGV